MSDKVLMENMLLLLKSTVEVYVHGSLESSNKPVHNALKSNLDEIIKVEMTVFPLLILRKQAIAALFKLTVICFKLH